MNPRLLGPKPRLLTTELHPDTWYCWWDLNPQPLVSKTSTSSSWATAASLVVEIGKPLQVFPLTVPNVQVSKYSAPAVSSTTHTAFPLAPKDSLTYVHVFAYTSNFSSVIGLHQCFPPPFQPSSRLLSFRIGITLCVRLWIPVLFRVNAFRFLRKSLFPRELVLLTDSLQRSLTLWKLSPSAFTRFVLVRFHLYPG